MPNLKYLAREKEKISELQKIPDESISTRVSVRLLFTFPDKRRADLTNKAESVMDMLVKGGVLDDDNWMVCARVILEFCGVNKDDCGVSIYIDDL